MAFKHLTTITINATPPTSNHFWKTMVRGKIPIVYKTKEAKDFADLCESEISQQDDFHNLKLKAKLFKFLSVEFEFHQSWLTKTKSKDRAIGEVKKTDLDNRIKASLDAICVALGIKDEHVFCLSAKKVDAPSDKIVFTLYGSDDQQDVDSYGAENPAKEELTSLMKFISVEEESINPAWLKERLLKIASLL